MRRLWLVLWLAVVGWDGLLPHIEPEWPRLALLALVAAGLLLIRRTGPASWVSRNLAIAVAAVCGIEAQRAGAFEVRALQDMFPRVSTLGNV